MTNGKSQTKSSSISLPARAWSKLMTRIRPWLMLSRVLVRKMHTDKQGIIIPPKGIIIRPATGCDLSKAYRDWPSSSLNSMFVTKAKKRGDICIAAFSNDTLVAFVWRSFSVASHTSEISVEVQKPYWYTYNMMTQTDFRGKDLGGLLTLSGDSLCQDAGYNSGVGFVETHNYSSLRANFKVGSKSVGFAGYFRIFGHTFAFRTPGVVPHTFRFVVHNENK